MRVSSEQKQAHRTRLLEAAAAEFAAAGLDGANVNRISVAAGLGKGTIYNYFPSKQDVFLAVVEEASARAAAGAAGVPPEAPTSERLQALLVSDVEWVREHPDFARVLVREALAGDARMHPRIVAAAAPFVSRVAEIVETGVERGEVRRDVEVERLAVWFSGLCELALTLHWGASGGWPELDAIPGFVTSMFLDGAAPRPDGGTAA